MEEFKLSRHTTTRDGMQAMCNENLSTFALAVCNTETNEELLGEIRLQVIGACFDELITRPCTSGVVLAKAACKYALGII